MSEKLQQYCFESEAHRKLFIHLHPELKAHAYSLNEFLVQCGWESKEDNDSRLDTLKSFTDFKAGDDTTTLLKLMNTLENLRLSLILNQEQVNYLFTVLPTTPKNAQIKKALEAYLNSPLVNDLSQRLWGLTGKLKMKELTPPFSEVIFVRAARSTFLFGEFSSAYASMFPASRTLEFWELKLGDSVPSALGTMPALLVGQKTQCLSAIASEAATSSARGLKHFISFSGSPSSLRFLELLLLNHKIRPVNLFTEQPEELVNGPNVILCPFQAIPNDSKTPISYYFDETILEFESELLLTEYELELLNQNGFTLPRLSTDKDYLKKKLKAAADTLGSNSLYSANPILAAELIPIATKAIPVEASSPKQRSENELVTLKFPGPTKLSATQLETYGSCPAKYFTSYRLGLRKKLTPEETYYLILGQITHLCLERALKESRNDFSKLFEEALMGLMPDLSPSLPLATMLKVAFLKLVSNFEQLEIYLRETLGMSKDVAFEQKFDWQLITPLGQFDFIGKMDRVVRNQDGNLLVLDYKTGSVDFSPNQVMQGKHFQALLYVLAAQKQSPSQTIGIAFYDLKEGQIKKGILYEPLLTKDQKKLFTRGHVMNDVKLEELLNTGKDYLERSGKNINEGLFIPTPDTTVCERCEAVLYCRKASGHV